jgi:hypothetical protein
MTPVCGIHKSEHKINAKLQYFVSGSCRKNYQGLLICSKTVYNFIRALKVRKSAQHEINAKTQHFATEMYINVCIIALEPSKSGNPLNTRSTLKYSILLQKCTEMSQICVSV